MQTPVELDTEAPAIVGLNNPLQPLSNALAAIGTAWIMLLMLLVVADVIGRNFLNAPITGVSEFAAKSVASIVFLQLAAAVASGRMTRSDFLLHLLSKRASSAVLWMELFNVVLGAVLFAFLAWIAWPQLMEAIKTAEFIGVQGVFTMPAWPFKALIVIGSVLAALAYIACIPSLRRMHAAKGAGK